MTSLTNSQRWSEGAFVYQIYPRSFMDSNGDGIGDLTGIISQLDYLTSLGVTAIWLSPFYTSPMVDFGYDVADYCDVDPMFGELADFDDLLSAAHHQNIKVMIDLVPNHTSDEHPWFIASAASTDNDYADWYVWRDPVGYDAAGQPIAPNNWREALAGGPAWHWHASRQQFYLHSFHIRQPDLNWTNPAVRAAIKQAMRFWLDHGVDGFRVDAVPYMAKDPLLNDDPVNPHFNPAEDKPYNGLLHENSHGWPAVYTYLSEMADVLLEPAYTASPRFMVTEAYPQGGNRVIGYLNYYVGMNPQVAAPFNFEGLTLAWQAGEWRSFLRAFHHALEQYDSHCVASYAFGNHDQSRLASRLGVPAARSASVLLLTLPGMVFNYYGDEIGMRDVAIPAEMVQDPGAADGVSGRDPERTPMQWSTARQAGFTTAVQAWLPVADDTTRHNVASQSDDPQSLLNLYRQLGQLRAKSEDLTHGDLHIIDAGHTDVLSYSRGNSFLIYINFSGTVVDCDLPSTIEYRCLISTHPIKRSGQNARGQMQAHQAVVYQRL